MFTQRIILERLFEYVLTTFLHEHQICNLTCRLFMYHKNINVLVEFNVNHFSKDPEISERLVMYSVKLPRRDPRTGYATF